MAKKQNFESWQDKAGNQVFLGNNLKVLKGFADKSFRLIYIDPPFNTGKDQKRKTIKVTPDKKATHVGFAGKKYAREEINTTSYKDQFDDYLAFLEPRLKRAHELLTDDGSLFFHIDWREAARCRILLEDIFGGPEHVINEIIWAYDFGARSKKKWPTKHDNIYWLAKDPSNYVCDLDKSDRLPYMAPNLQSAERLAKGKTPTDTWWNTIVPTNSKEKTGYPTQKPISILKRIINVHSEPGDTVLDFFAGSGTTGAAAIACKRKFVLVDEKIEALKVICNRLNLTK